MLASLAACRFGFDDVARERDASTTSSDGDATSAVLHFAYLKASNTGAFDHFGWATAVSGDGMTLVVGAVAEGGSVPGINASDGSSNGVSQSGAVYVFVRVGATWQQQAYIKQQALDTNDAFGGALALSTDGNTLAVGEPNEDSAATTINGSQTDNSATDEGAVFVFTRSAGAWTQQAFIKCSNCEASDQFGASVALDATGDILAAGAPGEDSAATTIDGNKASNAAAGSGAAYLFTRSGTTWTEQTYFKAWNAGAGDMFGSVVALSDDGTTLAVGAPQEDGSLPGVQNATFAEPGATVSESGAAYVFHRSGAWTAQAYVKPSDVGFGGDFFAYALGLSGDGNVLACGAPGEDSVVGNSGAVWMFRRSGATWAEEARLKASNAGDNDQFGASLSLAGGGGTLMASSPLEDSNASGVGGDQTNDASQDSGAVYSFDYGNGWTQSAYAKANAPDLGDQFGFALALSRDGQTRIATATYEDSAATGIDGDALDNTDTDSGCAGVAYYAAP